MEKEIKKVYTVNLKPSIAKKAQKKAAEKDKRSFSAQVEVLLEEYIKEENEH